MLEMGEPRTNGTPQVLAERQRALLMEDVVEARLPHRPTRFLECTLAFCCDSAGRSLSLGGRTMAGFGQAFTRC
jgi:hypothetical protein